MVIQRSFTVWEREILLGGAWWEKKSAVIKCQGEENKI